MRAEDHLDIHTGKVIHGQLRKDVILAMKIYAIEKCGEQRRLCATDQSKDLIVSITKEPEFD